MCLLDPLPNAGFFSFCVCFFLFFLRCTAIIPSATHRNTEFTGFIPPEFQLIVRSCSHHHGPQDGPEAQSSSKHADPRRVLRRRDASEPKARANRPLLPSLLLANMRSLENKQDALRAKITTQRKIRERCALIFTETWQSAAFRYDLTPYSEETGLQPPVRPKGEVWR